MDILKNGGIWIYTTIGKGVVSGDEGVSPTEIRDALAELGGRDVTVRINSGGGWSNDGVAICNQLKAYAGKVTTIVEGIAASAASVVAMGGSEIIMRPGAYLMVHEATGFTVGDAMDHSKTIEALETVNRSMADIYVKQTRRPVAEIRREMADETWMTAEEAVKKRYATRVADGGRTAQKSTAHAAFAWNDAYCRAPTQIAAMAGTAQLSAGFKAAMARAERARSEELIEDLIRKFWPSRRHDPDAQQALAVLKESYPAAVERVLTRPAGVIAGPWRDVINRQNEWFSTLYPGK